MLVGVPAQAVLLDRLALVDHLIDEVGVLVGEVRAHRVQVRVHQGLEERLLPGRACLRAPCAADYPARARYSRAGMAHRDEIVAYLDELLDAPGWPDYGPNGLQVPGADEVELVVTGVSAHGELFERAATPAPQWSSATTGSSGTRRRGRSARR